MYVVGVSGGGVPTLLREGLNSSGDPGEGSLCCGLVLWKGVRQLVGLCWGGGGLVLGEVRDRCMGWASVGCGTKQ